MSDAPSFQELRSPYGRYTLKLSSFVPEPNRVAGVLVRARINGGRELRMLLDSGAQNVVMGRREAAACGLAGGAPAQVQGWGSRLASISTAQRLDIGPLAFSKVPIVVVDGTVLEGVDGIVPLAIFSDFFVRLDLPRRTLDLIPFSSAEGAPLPRHGVTSQLLVIDAVLNGETGGHVLVDTGAFRTAVEESVAESLNGLRLGSRIRLQGAGTAEGRMLRAEVRFRVGDTELVADQPIAIDLTAPSRQNGIAIMGVIGFRDLSTHLLAIDYRSGKVNLDPEE